jgi:hypothetical protein
MGLDSSMTHFMPNTIGVGRLKVRNPPTRCAEKPDASSLKRPSRDFAEDPDTETDDPRRRGEDHARTRSLESENALLVSAINCA